MKSLYDVQEWLKTFGYVNLMADRLDAIYFMKVELSQMIERGILERTDQDYMTASLILRREERIETEKRNEL
ncbi:YqgQ family protein [Lactococcus termiticola]|uniref:DUF910 domain-containing protein n=1 Tax=Lactococcus termiticola TaxID=2169526 RepID=A0A2R5HIC4_9LACT|nr:YqgQ family protein [Lactococcus termiticola]GBG96048.1 hypothetical protein NtB2_00151 [Lactococcus termiticola]